MGIAYAIYQELEHDMGKDDTGNGCDSERESWRFDDIRICDMAWVFVVESHKIHMCRDFFVSLHHRYRANNHDAISFDEFYASIKLEWKDEFYRNNKKGLRHGGVDLE